MQNVLGQKEVLEENLECFYEKKSRKLHCLGELECGEVVWLSLEKVAAAATTSINIRGASKHFHKSFSNGEPSSQHHHQHPKHTLANMSPDPDQVETKEEEVRHSQHLSSLWRLPSSAVKGFSPAMKLGSSKRLQRRHNHSAFHVGFIWIKTNLDNLEYWMGSQLETQIQVVGWYKWFCFDEISFQDLCWMGWGFQQGSYYS